MSRLLPLLVLAAVLGAGEADPGAFGLSGDRVHADAVRIGPLEFTDVTGKVTVGEGSTTISGMRAKAYGGTVQGKLVVDGGGCRLLIIARDLVLDRLMASLGAPGEFGGTIDGEVVLAFTGNANDQVRGGGSLHLREGSFISLPFLAEVLFGDFLAKKGQDTLDVEFALENNTVRCTRIVAENPSVKLKGSGTIDFLGELDLVLTPTTRPLFAKGIPLIGDVLGWFLGKFSGVVGRFEVVGHVGAPIFRPKIL